MSTYDTIYATYDGTADDTYDGIPSPPAGHLILTGYAPAVFATPMPSPTSGHLVLSGYSPIVLATRIVTASPHTRRATVTGTGRRASLQIRFRYQRRTIGYVFRDDVTAAFVGGSIELDNDRPVVRTARFVILPERLPADWDWQRDLVAVVVEHVETVAGVRRWVTCPFGLFRLAQPERNYGQGQARVAVDASDTASLLIAQTTPTVYTVMAGAAYTDALSLILYGFGMPAVIPVSPSVLPVDLVWGPATPWYTIVSDLAAAVNFYPPYPDRQGVWRTRERLDPATEAADKTYSAITPPFMCVMPFTTKIEVPSSTNRIVVLQNDPRRTPFYELWENQDPSSLLSTVNAGGSDVQEVNGDRVPDAATAAAIAKYLLRDGAGRVGHGTLRTILDCDRDAHESYILDLPIGVEGEMPLWRVLGWQVNLETGAIMTHNLARSQPVGIVQP